MTGIAALLTAAAASAFGREQGAGEKTDVPPNAFTLIDPASCVFADRPTVFRFAGVGIENQTAQLEWRLSIGDRVVSQGPIRPEKVVDAVHGDQIAFSLKMPPVKPGVILAAELHVAIFSGNMRLGAGTQPLFIFAKNPFVDRKQWLADLQIGLFDSDGVTATVFENHEIPFTRLNSAEAIDAARSNVLIIAEGTSWNDYSGVMKAVRRAAQRGRRVLCLAPSEGNMPLYAAMTGEQIDVSTLLAADENVIRRFDKRFDTRVWLGGPSVVSRLGLVSEKDVVLARVTDTPAAWPWIELNYGDTAGEHNAGMLIICGLGVIKYWEAGPVPRYLLKAILESPVMNYEIIEE